MYVSLSIFNYLLLLDAILKWASWDCASFPSNGLSLKYHLCQYSRPNRFHSFQQHLAHCCHSRVCRALIQLSQFKKYSCANLKRTQLTSSPELLKFDDGKLNVNASFQICSLYDFFENSVFFFFTLFPFWIR